MNNDNLIMMCTHGGCAAKVNADILDQIISLWKVNDNDKVILGLQNRDDVGCYSLGGKKLLVHSIDVITPIINDANSFGSVAVAHALSDIYAKGASPISALSFLGLPSDITVDGYLKDIIAGCSMKLQEAGIVLLGGHTIFTSELLIGFAVTGIVDANKMLTMQGACPGDKLILTKALGSGIISAAIRLSNSNNSEIIVQEDELSAAIFSMTALNQQASRLMIKYGASACTDVSGFGLMGHLTNLVRSSRVGARIYFHAVHKLPGVFRLLGQGITPNRLDENIQYYNTSQLSLGQNIDSQWPILFCPETSGGLLIAIGKDIAQELLDSIRNLGITDCDIIGELFADDLCRITIEN